MRISEWSSDVCSSDLPASRMAPRDGLDDRLHLPGGHFIAEAPGDLPRVERFVAGEQHSLYRAFQIVDHARCSTLDRKSVAEGKRVSVRVVLGGWRLIKNKNKKHTQSNNDASKQ